MRHLNTPHEFNLMQRSSFIKRQQNATTAIAVNCVRSTRTRTRTHTRTWHVTATALIALTGWLIGKTRVDDASPVLQSSSPPAHQSTVSTHPLFLGLRMCFAFDCPLMLPTRW